MFSEILVYMVDVQAIFSSSDWSLNYIFQVSFCVFLPLTNSVTSHTSSHVSESLWYLKSSSFYNQQ